MPLFHHHFTPAGVSGVGPLADLTVREIEDAGVLEVLQTPGAAYGTWSVLDALLDSSKRHFVFKEPLGLSREVKTALSGLFGRFVARAYATKFLGFDYFQTIHAPPMTLSGVHRGRVLRTPGAKGDLPDWAAWSSSGALGIIEAKGCHDPGGPKATLLRADVQAQRAEIRVGGRFASFKRYAIVTRWGVATPKETEPLLWVMDPPIDGEATQEEMDALGVGIARLHHAALMRGLGFVDLATSLAALAKATGDFAAAAERARTALAETPKRRLDVPDGRAPSDQLVGGFLTRGGPVLRGETLTVEDQETLKRLRLNPTFVGVETSTINALIDGDLKTLRLLLPTEAVLSSENVPTLDRSGAWVARLVEDRATVPDGE